MLTEELESHLVVLKKRSDWLGKRISTDPGLSYDIREKVALDSVINLLREALCKAETNE